MHGKEVEGEWWNFKIKVHKFGALLDIAEDQEDVSTQYLEELNRGGLHLPKLSTVFFVHSAHQAHGKVSAEKQRCKNYLKRLFAFIDAPIASNKNTCTTMSNIVLKALVLNNSDKEK